MSRERDDRGRRAQLDEAISAWVDGELAPREERELRARLEAGEPELLARVEAFRRVDSALRALPLPEVRPELAERVRRAVADTSGSASSEAVQREAQATPRRPRSAPRRRRVVAVAASAAAALLAALLLLSSWRGDEAAPTPLAESSPGAAPAVPAPPPVVEPPADDAPARQGLPPEQRSLWRDVPDDELAIALELEALADFEVIEQLEVLERLVALDDRPEGLGS